MATNKIIIATRIEEEVLINVETLRKTVLELTETVKKHNLKLIGITKDTDIVWPEDLEVPHE